jgi:hypothetical protein
MDPNTSKSRYDHGGIIEMALLRYLHDVGGCVDDKKSKLNTTKFKTINIINSNHHHRLGTATGDMDRGSGRISSI